MYTLTKEEFWNEMESKYPQAFAFFSKWIDEYKKEVNWDRLFAPGVKFHDLPFEMQNGIIARFDIGCAHGVVDVYKSNMPMYKRQFESLFADIQKYKIRQQTRLN